MGITPPATDEQSNITPDVGRSSPTGMQRPQHGECDSEETACLDDVLQDAALRDSVLRTPR
jgi:hypothetical protein